MKKLIIYLKVPKAPTALPLPAQAQGCPHLPMAQDLTSPPRLSAPAPGVLHQGQPPPPHCLILPGCGP